MVTNVEDGIILYIKDPLSQQHHIKNVTQHMPYQLHQANSAARGLEAMRRLQPSLVLLDLNLSDMHGFDLVQHIKNDHVLCDIPVVALAADKDTCQAAIQAGCTAYLKTPVSPSRLLKVLRQLII